MLCTLVNLGFLLLVSLFFPPVPSCLFIYSVLAQFHLSLGTMVRERSRSRDDPPMWGHPNPNRPHDPTHHRRWNYTPALRRTRRVLILINLDATKQLVNEQMSDVMDVTTCEHLPDLRPAEELSLFTYSWLLSPSQIQIVTVGVLLDYISQYIFNTCSVHIDANAMDLRWSDCTGDTFALRPHQIITRLLRDHRPRWTEAQEVGSFNTLVDFTHPGQPYIMRLSCHKALPNPNHLP